MKTNTLFKNDSQNKKKVDNNNKRISMDVFDQLSSNRMDYFGTDTSFKKFKVESMSHYPGPFDQKTSIVYKLERPSYVTLVVYNPAVEGMTCLVCGYQHEGCHKVDFDASKLPAGVYVAHLRTNEGALKEIMTKLGSNYSYKPD